MPGLQDLRLPPPTPGLSNTLSVQQASVSRCLGLGIDRHPLSRGGPIHDPADTHRAH